MIIIPRSRKGLGIALIVMAVICLILGINDTVKYSGEIDDYHSLTADTVKTGKLVEGTIDEWYGPFAYTDDGTEVYFLGLDNGQLISFKTNKESQKEAFASYDGITVTTVEMDFAGKVESMPEEDEDLMLEVLVDEGFTSEEAEEILIPYYLINYSKSAMKIFYIVAVVTGVIGIALFIPEIIALLGYKGVKKDKLQPEINTNNGYQNAYSATQNTYGGTAGVNNYAGYGSQQNSQNNQYPNNQYPAQGQNAQYPNNQYSAQGQNVQYPNNQCPAQSQGTSAQQSDYNNNFTER